jgi:sugar phosphate isomerase/epimerase
VIPLRLPAGVQACLFDLDGVLTPTAAVHAKDMEIDRDGLYRNGTLSLGMGWQIPRLPGLGQVDWGRFIGTLYRVGYDGVVSVEHEDRSFEQTQELVERGFLIARDVLRAYLH